MQSLVFSNGYLLSHLSFFSLFFYLLYIDDIGDNYEFHSSIPICTPYTEMIRARDEALSVAEKEKESKAEMKIKFDINENEKISACTAMIKMQKKLNDLEESMMRLVKSCEIQIITEKKRRDMDVQSVIIQHNHQLSELKRLHKAVAAKQFQSTATASAAAAAAAAAVVTVTPLQSHSNSNSNSNSQTLKSVTEHTLTSTSTSTSTSGNPTFSSFIASSNINTNTNTNSSTIANSSSSNSETHTSPVIVPIPTSILTKSPSSVSKFRYLKIELVNTSV